MATTYICPKCGTEYKLNRDEKSVVTNLVCESCGKIFMCDGNKKINVEINK